MKRNEKRKQKYFVSDSHRDGEEAHLKSRGIAARPSPQSRAPSTSPRDVGSCHCEGRKERERERKEERGRERESELK